MRNKKGILAISQIFILVIGIIAISYAIGSEVRVVSGADGKEVLTPEQVSEITGAPPTTSTPPTTSAGIPTQQFAKGLPPGGEGAIASGPTALGNFAKHLGEGLMWAFIIAGAIQLLGPLFLNQRAVNALSIASGVGIMSAKIGLGIFGEGGFVGTELAGGLLGATGIGILAGIIIFFIFYGKESQEKRIYSCYPWDAPVGGADCHECNEQGILPCSEYQCRSLGQACELLNAGTDEEKCTWVHRNDVKFPTITPWTDALPEGYSYTPAGQISPPDKGVYIKYDGGCIPAFTPITFGITTNEPARCKIDYLRKKNFDLMSLYFGGSSLFKEQHNQSMSLPGSSALEAEGIEIRNNGNYEMYVRCQDANGNSNTANFVFMFCVDRGPDTTHPLIVTTDLLNGQPIAFNQSSVGLEVYVNEPAECRWSHRDQSYENMEEEMSCSISVMEMNAQMLYKCTTTLKGLKDRVENKFYFRCKDQPIGVDESKRNVNTESYKFSLMGTRPLVIDSVKPKDGSVVKDATDVIKVSLEVKTSAGYKEGEASCYYSESCYEEEGDLEDYTLFAYESGIGSYEHKQDLWMPKGTYKCSIKCVDLGGNTDYASTSFDVETDSSAPIIVRAYHEGKYLKIITSEKAECVYDIKDCSYLFEDGIAMSDVDGTEHFVDWDTKTNLYIKCQDSYGIRPNPNECSMIVRPFDS